MRKHIKLSKVSKILELKGILKMRPIMIKPQTESLGTDFQLFIV